MTGADLRALTVYQPWASSMFRKYGRKDVENRRWYLPGTAGGSTSTPPYG
jgi:hypothetical protein